MWTITSQKLMIGAGVRKIKINNSEIVINYCSILDVSIKCSNSTATIGLEIRVNSERIKSCIPQVWLNSFIIDCNQVLPLPPK